MIAKKEITPKEWQILQLFIVNESSAIERNQYNLLRKHKGLMPKNFITEPFFSYPDEIVRLLHHDVTISTAINTCKKFSNLGIFGCRKDRYTKNRFIKRPQYYLKSDFDTLKKVISIMRDYCDTFSKVDLLSHAYFRTNINEDFIRCVLFDKNVSILSRIDPLDWSPDQLHQVLKVWQDDPSYSIQEYAEYLAEKIKEMDADAFAPVNAKDWFFLPAENMSIPVLPKGMGIDKKMDAIEKKNVDQTKITILLKKYPDAYKNHAHFVEKQKIILPILSMITCSPAALEEFVFGSWEPFEILYGIFDRDKEKISNRFFRALISLTLGDMTKTLTIPGNQYAKSLSVREMPAERSITGDENREDALFMVSLTCDLNIFFDMGYATSKRNYPSTVPTHDEGKPDEKEFWVKIWIKEGDSFFLKNYEIKDPSAFVRFLQGSDKTSSHIRSRLSHRAQNLLRFYDASAMPSSAFLTLIAQDINDALRKDGFFDRASFSGIAFAPETMSAIDGVSKYFEHDDGDSGAQYSLILYRNRLILDDICPGILYRFGEYKMPVPKKILGLQEKVHKNASTEKTRMG